MTAAQFNKALARNGMEWTFMGYVCVFRHAKGATNVYAGNGGTSRRARLAYLIKEQRAAEAEHAAKETVK